MPHNVLCGALVATHKSGSGIQSFRLSNTSPTTTYLHSTVRVLGTGIKKTTDLFSSFSVGKGRRHVYKEKTWKDQVKGETMRRKKKMWKKHNLKRKSYGNYSNETIG